MDNKSTITNKPPGRLRTTGRKAVAVILSMALMLSALSFTAIAEEVDSGESNSGLETLGDNQSSSAGTEIITQEDATASTVVPLAGNTLSSRGFSPMALDYLYVTLSNEGSTAYLYWDEVTGASSYTIERAYPDDEGEVGTYELLATQITTGYTDNFITYPPGQDYFRIWYRVVAYASDGSVVDEDAKSYFMEPIPYIELSATPTSLNSIELSWTDIDFAETYKVYRSLTEDGTYTAVGTTSNLSYEDKGLIPEVTYYYRVVAIDEFDYVVGESPSIAANTSYPTPTNVAAEALDTSSIKVTWNAIDGVVGYLIYRADEASGTYSNVGYSFTAEFTNVGLQEDKDYYYKVAILDPSGIGPQSNYAHARTMIEIPGKTQNLNADALSTSEIKVSWDSVAKADSYRVYCGLTPTTITDLIGETADTSLIDSGLASDTTYYYRVEAVNRSGAGELSDPASATTNKDLPGAPTNANAVALSSSIIQVSWDAVPNATRYQVYAGIDPDEISTLVSVTPYTSIADTNLDANTTYYYRVVGVNDAGTGPDSNIASATTHNVVPVAPINVEATALGTSSIQVTWSAVSNATSYRIYAGTSSTSITRLVGTAYATSITDINLTQNTTYYYRVEAVNSAGAGPLSNIASATTSSLAPSAPINVRATALGPDSIQVSWSAVSGATGYIVYRSLTANGSYAAIGSTTSTNYVNRGLNSGTTYYYKVVAFNGYGYSPQSNYASATTVITCVLPYITATAKSSSSIQIDWTKVSGATGYMIYRSSSAAGTYTLVGTSFTTSYLDTGLAADTVYYYKAAAYSSAGIGPQTAYASARTFTAGPAAPPFWLKANGAYNIITYSPQINFAIYPGTMNQNYRICIYRATSPSGPYTKITTYTPNWPNANQSYSYGLVYNDNTLFAKGTKLYYKVSSIDISGKEGPLSDYRMWTAGYAMSMQDKNSIGSAPANLGRL